MALCFGVAARSTLPTGEVVGHMNRVKWIIVPGEQSMSNDLAAALTNGRQELQ